MFKKRRRWHCLPGKQPTEFDKQIMYWENKGKLVPTRGLVKSQEQLDGIRKGGDPRRYAQDIPRIEKEG